MGVFASTPSQKEPYSILMPPPNVTGILHFGHVLNHTIQDIYIRWNRQLGKETCWFPGLDHAGIATQTKVEQQLESEGTSRTSVGREQFVQRVWDWKNQYGTIILQQLETLGNSSDWNRTLFTMDSEASEAVRDMFIDLYRKGLIYRGTRIINWSPRAQSALSDEEVVFKEVREHMVTMRYAIEGTDSVLLVASVRPETIFADVAVAVNPDDERYAHLVGRSVVVPLTGKRIPVIADTYADPSFGTGCVKVTPAHDKNDYEIGLRHALEMPSCINADGTLNDLAGQFEGHAALAARKHVITALDAAHCLESSEPYTHNVGFSERGGEPVEPRISAQWFVRMQPLAPDALKVVQEGRITFYPEHWTKTYEYWLTNIQDWCISRQLWWGHRIPVYYTPSGEFTAATSEEEARQILGVDASVEITQDPDVLDTWFSSWLWPVTTMSSRKTSGADVWDYYAPTNLLVTAPDIIFFWVARMIIATLYLKQEIPFKDVYFTSVVRDSKGRKLSKSLGNSPDPLTIIQKYGSDAVRFTMIYLAPLGSDVRLDIDEKSQDIPSMELGRNFANKVWNAARFLQMKITDTTDGVEVVAGFEQSVADQWIQSRLETTLRKATETLDNYKLTDYCRVIYDFLWRDFCDWYIEVMKVQFNGSSNPQYRTSLLWFAKGILEVGLQLLHPIMPFITEELWWNVCGNTTSISISPLPKILEEHCKPLIEKKFALLQLVVESVRRTRGELQLAWTDTLPVHIVCQDDMVEFFETQRTLLEWFMRAASLEIRSDGMVPSGSICDIVQGIETFVVVKGVVDTEKELERLSQEFQRIAKQRDTVAKKLENTGFLKGASKDVIEGEQKKVSDWSLTLEKLSRNIKALQA
jgi:valyl-tRNA synthetase